MPTEWKKSMCFWELLQDCWKTIPGDYVIKLTEGIPRICKAVINQKVATLKNIEYFMSCSCACCTRCTSTGWEPLMFHPFHSVTSQCEVGTVLTCCMFSLFSLVQTPLEPGLSGLSLGWSLWPSESQGATGCLYEWFLLLFHTGPAANMGPTHTGSVVSLHVYIYAYVCVS